MKPNHNIYLALCMMLWASLAIAQTGVGVSPSRFQTSATPGATITRVVTVDNPGQVGTLVVDSSISDALLQANGAISYLEPGSHERSLGKWISVNPLKFTIGASQKQDVTYTIRVPNDAKDGSYWGLILFESGPASGDGQPQGFGVRVRVRVAHVIYVDVGKITRAGRIMGVRYQEQVGEQPSQVRVVFQNTGNGILRLKGRAEVRDTNGHLVATATLVDSASFPGATHEVGLNLEKPLPKGRYVVLASLDVGESRLVGGQANIEVK